MTNIDQSTEVGPETDWKSEMKRLRDRVELQQFPETLGDFVKHAAECHGENILAEWLMENETLTYAELDQRADRVAARLVGSGLRKGAHVGVMLPNVPAYPILWVALSRVGAVMVPINVSYRKEDFNFVVTDADVECLVIDESYLEVLEQLTSLPPLLDKERIYVHGKASRGYSKWDTLLAVTGGGFEPPSAIGRTDLLTIQYTSGTTGFPKGCMLSHDYWLLTAHVAAAPHDDDNEIERILIWQPFFYMDGMWLLLMAMKLGATAYVARKMKLREFRSWLARCEINYCIFPEPALSEDGPVPLSELDKLKYVSIFGWRRESRYQIEKNGHTVAREGYGMTEIGLSALVPTLAKEKSKEITFGLPGPFRQFRIRDEQGNTVSDEQVGQLWVAGRAVLWGYYKRPEANRNSFNGRWFRTGDLAWRDRDGFYYLVGREKDMVRRAGENISAREVESTIAALPQVLEVAVVPVPDERRREEVKAYLLLQEGLDHADCPPQTVIDYCQERLAEFKIPRYIAYVSEFPRTPSRKVKKQELVAASDELSKGGFDRESGKWR